MSYRSNTATKHSSCAATRPPQASEVCILELGRVFGYARVSKPLTGDVRGRRSGVEVCVQIGNPLLSELRIPYCVSAGETAAILLLYSPEKSRLQTGFTSISSAPSRVWSRLVAFSRAQFFFSCPGTFGRVLSYLVVSCRHFSSFLVISRHSSSQNIFSGMAGNGRLRQRLGREGSSLLRMVAAPGAGCR